jgi:RHS repeat-associated protein
VSKVDSSSSGGQKTGPSLLLKVMSGDSVQIGVQCFYNSGAGGGTNNSSFNNVLSSLTNALASATAAGAEGGSSAIFSQPGSSVYTGLTSFLSSNDSVPANYPKAYINWIFLDDQFNYVSGLSGSVQAASSNYPAGQLNFVAPGSQLTMNRNGYLYIWVSNETQGWDVFFDNLAVQYKQGPLLEENHYYPFGLNMAGISDKAIKTNYAENKFRYNGGAELQNKEFSDGTGLEVYDAGFRTLDPQLGRFSQIDPLADKSVFSSTYNYAGNNPILANDPTGLLKQNPQEQAEEAALMEQAAGGGGGGGGGGGSDVDESMDDAADMSYSGQMYLGGGVYELPDGEIVDQSTAVAYAESTYGGGVNLTGGIAQTVFSAFQSGMSDEGDGSTAHLLLIGGWDYANTGLSRQSMAILSSFAQNMNVSVDWYDPKTPYAVEGAAQGLASSLQGMSNIYIYGYSLGGAIALQVARDLNESNTPVDLLLTVDAADGYKDVDRTVTPNVSVNWNYYQTNYSLLTGSHGGPNTADDPTSTLIININCTGQSFFNSVTNQYESVTHGNMSQYTLSSVIFLLNYYMNNQ